MEKQEEELAAHALGTHTLINVLPTFFIVLTHESDTSL